jgi:hypothetical protein
MRRAATGAVGIAMAALLTATGLASAQPADRHVPTRAGDRFSVTAPRDGQLFRDVSAVDRDTTWSLVDKLDLDFSTFHTEGLAVTPHHLFLSAVEILEPTQKYPEPVNGYDRTPGKGIGHLFVLSRSGRLQKDIVLGGGHRYHPGGIDFDGRNVWVPVAEYPTTSVASSWTRRRTTWWATPGARVASTSGASRDTGRTPGRTPATSSTTRTVSTSPPRRCSVVE